MRDDLRQAVKFKTIEFDPRLGDELSPYMGEPNPGVDRLWDKLATSKYISLGMTRTDSVKRSLLM